ncbi:hypothetical protein KAR91_35135 [Candidatus Pacearchaeota archaeon]|nr:hypothetical protein [Candidatus Pacearchaeota archaeon]
MTSNDIKKLKIGDEVKNLGSGLVYTVAEIDPDIVLLRGVMGEDLTVFGMSHYPEWIMVDNLLSLIKDAREALKVARELKCICSGFQRHYEGCKCETGYKIKAAERHFWRLIKAID